MNEKIGQQNPQENAPHPERGEGARRLHEFEATGEYVFHGSPTPNLAELEPRQGHHIDGGQPVPDGSPAVAASARADIAIFKALVRGGASRFGSTEEGVLNFGATDDAIERARTAKGFVYIFRRDDFAPVSAVKSYHEWRSPVSVRPVRVVPVRWADLPPDIERIDSVRGNP
jgi:hypothetical protein